MVIPASHQSILVMNAYPPNVISSDLTVQVRVVPPTGSPMATQTGCPDVPAVKVTLIDQHTQETGLMTHKGAGRVSGY